MLKRLLFKKIQIWVVIYASLMALMLGFLFAGLSRYYAMGGDRLGALGPIVDRLASIPERLIFTLRYQGWDDTHFDLRAGLVDRFPGESGMRFFYDAGSRPNAGYALINRFDADRGYSVVDLWDLDKQVLRHTWHLVGVSELWSNVETHSTQVNLARDRPDARFRGAVLLESDGSLVVSDETPIVKFSPCSVAGLLVGNSIYHHSVERGLDESIWVARYQEPKSVTIGRHNFVEDMIVNISRSGVVKFEKSVIKILEENKLDYLVYGQGGAQDDPIHLNDIEPVLSSGLFWSAGDVFLSLRNRSLVLLYRPSSNEVVWYKQGPWVHQHDVGIVGDGKISVFNNRAYRSGVDGLDVKGSNNLLIYDFRLDDTVSPWQLGFEKTNVRTATEGRGTVVEDEVFVEESNYGRLLQFDKRGGVSWSYVNRASNGKVYIVSWSRVVSSELAKSALSGVVAAQCGNQ